MADDVKWESDDVVLFGRFRLFPANRLLEKAGIPVRLGDRALEILLILIGHAAKVVSNASLLAQVWPDLIVEENNVRVQVTLLRKALGDGKAGTRYISTVPGRGYCFVSPVWRLKMPPRPPAFVSDQGDDLLVPARRNVEPPPALASESAKPRTNLPQRLAPVIGRASELAELRERIGTNQLVT